MRAMDCGELKMSRGTRNEFTGNRGICCSAASFSNIENRIAGLDVYTIDDMRKDACKRCKYHDMYPQCNYGDLIHNENTSSLFYYNNVRWLEGEGTPWLEKHG